MISQTYARILAMVYRSHCYNLRVGNVNTLQVFILITGKDKGWGVGVRRGRGKDYWDGVGMCGVSRVPTPRHHH